MNEMMIMAIGLAILSVASGMLGLGVAFAAVPFLALFLHDLVARSAAIEPPFKRGNGLVFAIRVRAKQIGAVETRHAPCDRDDSRGSSRRLLGADS